MTYKLALHDGRVLRTRISRPVASKGEYSRSMWSHVLKEQLDVTADEFWACARDGSLPDRGTPETREAPNAVPLHLVRELTRLGVPEGQVLDLDPAEAAALLAHTYAELQDDVLSDD
ncbi:cytotoxic translational repressor of toxin-antitoxin stability system [Citricoccus nitrophenolicus]|uniref:Cytotoxic translational repressor of toxin-antitoxin stability system n=1 Tax=Citricoccus nitrophenolicus TaxID=863575 RepID=A0ABV0IKW4_9MICC